MVNAELIPAGQGNYQIKLKDYDAVMCGRILGFSLSKDVLKHSTSINTGVIGVLETSNGFFSVSCEEIVGKVFSFEDVGALFLSNPEANIESSIMTITMGGM